MPRQRHQLRAPDYAILGLLMMGPRHGYELAPYFARQGELGLVCTLGIPRLYALLHTLEELGHVQSESSTLSGGPPRKIFSLTEGGNSAFRAWLDEPIERLRRIRQDFLLKLYFARKLEGQDPLRVINAQIEACRSVSDDLSLIASEAGDAFPALVYQSRKVLADATVTWLQSERERSLHSSRV